MSKQSQVTYVPLKSIVPDENQPRKYFDPGRINELKESLKTHGIMNPLLVEKQDDGTYLLIDGERRLRASSELKLSEVPVIVLPKMSGTDRLIKQFHAQEQHEGWTGIEKALAMKTLSAALGMSMKELGKVLGIPERTITTYISFADLLEHESYQKNELPLKQASSLQHLKAQARKAMQDAGKDFFVEDERALEKAVIKRMKDGEIREAKDFQRIADSFRQDAKSIERFVKKNASAATLYRETNAEAFTNMRRLTYSAGYIATLITSGRKSKFQKLFEEHPASRATILKSAEALAEFAREIA